jgi:transposase
MAKHKAGYRHGVSDQLWSRFEPLIPEHKNTHRFGGGRPRVPDRRCLEGIVFVLRTGCQWKALDATGIVSGSTAHSRFQAWAEAGVFRQFWLQGRKRSSNLSVTHKSVIFAVVQERCPPLYLRAGQGRAR